MSRRPLPSYISPPEGLVRPPLPAAQQYGGRPLGRRIASVRGRAGDLIRPHTNRWWAGTSMASESLAILETLEGSQSRQTGVLVCNGPSLNKTDLHLLAGHPFILLNRGYLLGDRLPGPPTALCSHDPLVLQQFGQEIGSQECLVMAPRWSARVLDRPRASRTAYVEIGRTWRFAARPTYELHHGATVTFWGLQLAYWLGWSKLLIIGMDHRFAGQDGRPSMIHTARADEDHFRQDYSPAGTKQHNPNVAASEYSYGLARHAWEQDLREVVDCTPGGACRVFRTGELARELDC